MNKSIFPLMAALTLYCGISLSFGQNVSDEARRYFDRGVAAVEMAKSSVDYEAAIKEFEQAALIAPDWPDVYRALGMVQEKAEKIADAARNLRHYLKLAPDARDSEEIKSLINKLEYKAENVLSVAGIIDVLTSFRGGEWSLEGKCVREDGELHIEREGDDAVKVFEALRAGKKGQTVDYQTLRVTGPFLKYRATVNVCGPDGLYDSNDKNSNCDCVIETEIEVVSKRLVRVNQEVLRGGFARGLRTGDRFAGTFRKKDGPGVNAMVSDGATINSKDELGRTPLHTPSFKDVRTWPRA